jgi:hypothetical protein
VKVWKYLVLLGGIVGVAGFFLAFITFRSSDGRIEGSASAYQLVRGIDDVSELVEGASPVVNAHPEVQQFVKTLNVELGKYRGALVGFYVPAALLALLGAFAGMRRRMGRIAGIVAIAIGAANAAIWVLFFQVSSEASTPEGTAAMGIGLHVLLAAGVAGMLAGLGALLAPDRGDAAV